jgi:hypothetical protein
MSLPALPKSVEEYLKALNEPRQTHLRQLDALIRETLPDYEVSVVGSGIGYGWYHYKYASGREGDWSIIGLSSRKQYISLYVSGGENGVYLAEAAKDKLPKADIGKVCIRFKKPEDLEEAVLRDLLKQSAGIMAPDRVPMPS